MTGRALTLLAVASALLAAALATRQAELAWLALPLLTTLGLALLTAPAARPRLRAERSVERQGPPERGRVAVTVRVWNEGDRTVHLCLRDAPPAGAVLLEGSAALRARLAPGQACLLQYAFAAARGRFAWTHLAAAAGDALGLLELELTVPAPGELHVHAPLPPLRPFPLVLRRVFPAPGPVPGRAGGAGTEFWGLRPFQPGDPLRRLDWRRDARGAEHLLTRELEVERTADVGLVVDASPATALAVSGAPLLEHALQATGALAELLLRQGHRVGLVVLGERPTAVAPGNGRAQRQRLRSCLAGVAPRAGRAPRSVSRALLRRCPARSLLVVVTPLEDEAAAELLLRLRQPGRRLLALSPDPCTRPAPADPLSALALRAARVERLQALRRLAQLGVPALDWRPDTPLAPLLRRALGRARGAGVRP
ncbi:MAG: DUF58 domain-containing protein [Anaeromyxobacter sp.]